MDLLLRGFNQFLSRVTKGIIVLNQLSVFIMKIKRAGVTDVKMIAGLFDLYRQFYDCKSDPVLSEQFIEARLANDESIIFLATDDNDHAVGFVQLYPSFCSIDAGKILILHDLYVDASCRKQGVGKLLMDRATEYARETGAGRLDLLTDKTNYPGQALYEKLGYEKTLENFFAYSLNLSD